MAKKAKTTAMNELPPEFDTTVLCFRKAPKGVTLLTQFPNWTETGTLRVRAASLLQPIYVEREVPFEFTNPRKFPPKHPDDTHCWLRDANNGALSTPFIQAGTVLRLTDRPNGKYEDSEMRRIFYIMAEAVTKEDFDGGEDLVYRIALGPFSSYTATWATLQAVAEERPGGPMEQRILAAKADMEGPKALPAPKKKR